MYVNMPIVPGSEPSPYRDTPEPYLFSTVSPLDPQLFSSILEYAGALLEDKKSAKYSPLDVAQWLENFTKTSDSALTTMRRQVSDPSKAEFRQWEEDVLIQIGLGRFFAAKLRSGMLFEIYRNTAYPQAGQLAVAKYSEARELWAAMAQRAQGVYKPDVTYGATPGRRGHWADRLPGIDRDLDAMRSAVAGTQATPDKAKLYKAELAVKVITSPALPRSIECTHTRALKFTPGKPLTIELHSTTTSGQHQALTVDLYYRHVNQAERWSTARMQAESGKFTGTIPGEYTNSAYPLQYYFLVNSEDSASLYPGFNAALSNQPYYAVWQREV
jgi:hypothetical protein